MSVDISFDRVHACCVLSNDRMGWAFDADVRGAIEDAVSRPDEIVAHGDCGQQYTGATIQTMLRNLVQHSPFGDLDAHLEGLGWVCRQSAEQDHRDRIVALDSVARMPDIPDICTPDLSTHNPLALAARFGIARRRHLG